MNDHEQIPDIAQLQSKYILIRKEVSEINNHVNEMYNQYIQNFIEYSEKRKEDLEKWRENEITYVEDEKERSISGCNSDCESYLAQIDLRYKMYLRFKAETLKKYFPQQYEYYRQNGLSIIQDIESVPSVTEERAPISSIRFSDKPLLNSQDIRNDINLITHPKDPVIKKDRITFDGKSYKIGDSFPIRLSPKVTCTAQLLFLKPKISILIDDEQFEVTPERFRSLIYM